MNSSRTLTLAGLLLAAATIFGALGAHALKSKLSPVMLDAYQTAVHYHFFNGLGLLGIGLTLRFVDARAVRWAAALVLVGVVMFSGSLYALTFGAPPAVFGPMTPLGGLLLIVGWLCFAAGVWRR